MNKNIERVNSIMNNGTETNEFIKMMTMPDDEFKKVYDVFKENMEEAFDTKEYREQVINLMKNYPSGNIDGELAAMEDAIKDFTTSINEDEELSKEKKDVLSLVINKSFSSLSKIMENPRNMVKVKVQRLKDSIKLPTYAHPTDAGADIAAAETVTIEPNSTTLVPTGLKFAIPKGYEISIRPRSGLSLNTPLRIANSPATIDAQYRGEVKIIMTNTGDKPYTINEGDRIAQAIINPVPMIEWEEVSILDSTDRNDKGFGSTG